MRVLIAGGLTKDHNEIAQRSTRKLGGGVTYSGTVYAASGHEALLCYASDDNSSQQLRQHFPAKHLHQQTSSVTTFVNRYNESGEREQEILQLAESLDCPNLSFEIDLLHLCPLHQRDLNPTWYQLGDNNARRKALDIQGLLRPSRTGIVELQPTHELQATIRHCSDIKASEREWEALLDYYACDEQTLLALSPDTRFLVTAGSRGGKLLQANAKPLYWTALKPLNHLDTTGAGDIFFAHFLLLSLQHPPDAELLTEADRLTNSVISTRT